MRSERDFASVAVLILLALGGGRATAQQCSSPNVICRNTGNGGCIFCPPNTQCIANDRCGNDYCCCGSGTFLCDLPSKDPSCVKSQDECYECSNGGIDCGQKKCCPAGNTCTKTGCCPSNAPNDCGDGGCCPNDSVCVSGGCCPKGTPYPCPGNTCSADPNCTPTCPQGYINCGNNFCCPNGSQCGQGVCYVQSQGGLPSGSCPNGTVRCGNSHCMPTGSSDCCASVGREDLYCKMGTCQVNGPTVTCNTAGNTPINPPKQNATNPVGFDTPTFGGGGGCGGSAGKKTGPGPGCFGLTIAGGEAGRGGALLAVLFLGVALVVRRRGR